MAHGQSQTRLQQQVRQQEALLRINRAVQEMTRPQDLEQVIQVCLEEIAGVGIDAQTMAIHRMMDPEARVVETFRIGPKGSMAVLNRRRAVRLTELWEKGEIECIEDLERGRNEQDIQFFRQKFDGLPIRTLLDVPFSRGIISTHSLRPNAFSDQDSDVLRQVAEIFSVGLSRLDDLERLDARHRQQEVLLGINRAVQAMTKP